MKLAQTKNYSLSITNTKNQKRYQCDTTTQLLLREVHTYTYTHTQKDTTSQLLHHVCEEFILCITYGGRTCGILILYNYQKQKVQVGAKREANLTANCMETSQPFTIIIAIRIWVGSIRSSVKFILLYNTYVYEYLICTGSLICVLNNKSLLT